MEGLAEGRIISREEKLKPLHGVKMAQDMWGTYGSGGLSVGYNSADYLANIDLSQGRDSQFSTVTAEYLGQRSNALLTKYGYNSIKPQLVNLMPKFVNLIHGKLMDINYKIGVDVIDQTSIDEKDQVKSMLTGWLKMKDAAAKYGVVFDRIKEESGMSELPDTTEDLEIMMTTIYKHYEAMKAELELMKVHNMNDWDAIKSKYIMELIQQGVAGIRTFVDQYGTIREEWFPMNRFIGSYSESEDFDNLNFAGIIDFLTPEQFYCEAKDSIPESEILALIKNHANITRKDSEWSGASYVQVQGKQKYIRVLRFQKLEEDIENWVELKDEFGNKYMSKRKANFVVAPEERPLYDKGEKSLFRTSTTTKYGGVWVVGSNTVYDYGIIQEGNGIKLDYHLYAPGMRMGKVTSVVSQIKEPVYMFSVAWSRLKHIIGQGWNGIVDINVDMMYNMSLGKGGRNLDASDVMDLFIMQQISLSKGKQHPNDANNGRAIQIVNEGLAATDFIAVMNLCIETIRNIIGINELSDASTPASGTLNGVMEMANQNSDFAIAHYKRAYNNVYRRCSLAILGYWKNIPDNMAWTRDYIVGLEAATTQEEWNLYNQELSRLVQVPLIEGGITAADKFELQYPNMKDLKQGEFMCKIRIRKNMAFAQAQAEKAQNAQYEGTSKNIQETLAADQQRAVMDLDIFMKKESFLTQELAKRQQAINQGALMVKQLEMDGRVQVADVQGKDSLLKHLTMNESDQKIAALKASVDAAKIEHDNIKHQIEMLMKDKEIDAKKEATVQKKAA